MKRSVVLLSSLLLAGCSADAEDESEGAGGTGGLGPEVLAQGSSSIGPVVARPDGDQTVCQNIRLDNREAGWVRRVRGRLTDGSHHLIVYVADKTEEDPAPFPCQGLSGIVDFDLSGGLPGIDSANVPIFIAQQRETELVLPRDEGRPVGFRIEPYQMLRFELHWYNTGSVPKNVVGDFEVDYLPETSPEAPSIIESNFAFWGTVAIDIEPRSSAQTPVIFQRALTDTKIFATTTHQHSRGTRMRIWHTDGNPPRDDQLIAEGLDWAEPPLVMLDPPLQFQPFEGLAYQCEWVNPSNQRIGFGEEFDDEMCFLWTYYYPSVGFDICVHFEESSRTGICNHFVR